MNKMDLSMPADKLAGAVAATIDAPPVSHCHELLSFDPGSGGLSFNADKKRAAACNVYAVTPQGADEPPLSSPSDQLISDQLILQRLSQRAVSAGSLYSMS